MSNDLNESWNCQCGVNKLYVMGQVTSNERSEYNVCLEIYWNYILN